MCLRQNVLFETKCVLRKICYLKNVFYEQNVLLKIKCVLYPNYGAKKNVLFKTKCVLWVKCADRQNISCLKLNVLYDQNVGFRQNVQKWDV